MKLFPFLVSIFFFSHLAQSQGVTRIFLNEPIEGLCEDTNIYVLFNTFPNQEMADCRLTSQEMIQILNDTILYLKDHPKTKINGMVSIIINCKGEVIHCVVDGKKQIAELNEELINYFMGMETWRAGLLDDREVDSVVFFSFEIKKGRFVP